MDYKEIANAIQLCGSEPTIRRCEASCPYFKGGDTRKCIPIMTANAAAAITDLLARAEAAERERDQAVGLYGLSKGFISLHDLDRLRELVEADQEGRCVVLPVKIGDRVYCLQSYFNDAKMKSERRVKCRTVDFIQSAPDLFECDGHIFKFGDIGKTVFLTREAAEAELNEFGLGRLK